jgi:RNA polymerase sigma factor (sigma-70 family)
LDVNELLIKARDGDLASETQLFQYLTTRFRHFAKRNIWNSEDCEEIVQEALMTVSDKYKEIDYTSSFIGWAHQVLQNKIMNFHSKKKRQSELQKVYEKKVGHLSPDHADYEFEQQLIQCLNELNRRNKRYARAVNLAYQGFTAEEICRKLDVTRDNFYSILSRSRSLLLLCLKKGTIER